MKKVFTMLMILVAGLTSVKATVITVSGDITSNQTWTANNVYRLSGFVYVKGGAELTIQPGTLIYGEKVTKGTLLICRGSKIHASGTACAPIVFTSEQPLGSRTYGDWGGVILLGKSTVNQTLGYGIIEGGVDNANGDGRYGWSDLGLSGPVLNDNTGEMEYVRIEYPGIAFLPNNEINGLTFGGVGSGTTINHIQVSYSGDDSYEWFGGTVNCDHLISFRGLDDELDTDNSFSGHVSFCVALRDPNVADVSGSNGFESDNDATGSTNAPFTSPVFSNITIVGPQVTPSTVVNSNFKRGAHIRRNSRCSVFNSIIMGWGPSGGYGVYIDGTSTQCNVMNGDLVMKNDFIAGCTNNFGQTGTAGCSFTTTSDWFTALANNNATYTNNSDVQLTDPFNLSNPNFLPSNTSPVWNAADYTDPKLAGFTTTNYVGAFGSTDWTKPWAEWDPNNENYSVSGTSNISYNPTITSASIIPEICLANGSIDITASAPAGGLTYSWSNSATSEDISSLTGGTYNVTVNSYGCTATGSYTVLSNPPVKPTLTASITECSISYTWPAVTYASTYEYRYKLTSASSYGPITSNGSSLNYSLTGLTAGTAYTIQVRSVCANGTTRSAWATKNSTTLSGCGPVTNVTLSNITSSSVMVSWNGSCNPVDYTVKYKKGRTGALVTLPNTANTSITITGLVHNAGYYVYVIKNCAGGSSTSVTATFTTLPSNTPRLENPDMLNANEISVFPNPANNVLNVSFEFDHADYADVQIFNVTGQMVYSNVYSELNGIFTTSIDLSNFVNGPYIIKVTNGIDSYTKQFIVNK